jgi:ABC-type nitrate/sulfonate/bicarbonate transport system substrate-binding protein
LTTIQVGVPAGLFEPLYPRAAKDAGIYAQAGLDLELVEVPGGDTVIARGVISGEFLVGRQGTQGVLSADAQGSDLVMVASPQNRLAAIFAAQEGFDSLQSLYDHSVGSNGPGGFLTSIIDAIYRAKGLDSQRLVYVNTGTSVQSLGALIAKKVDASLVNLTELPIVTKSGARIVPLAHTAEDIPNFLRVVLTVRRNTIDDQDELLRRFFVAHSRAYRWALSNKDAVVRAAVEYQKRDPAEAAANFDLLFKPGLMTPDLSFSEEQIDYMQNLSVLQGGQKEILPFDRVANLRYVKAIAEELGPYVFPEQ